MFDIYVPFLLKMKRDVETATIGCVIGVCAFVSGEFKLIRSILCKLSELCGNYTYRGGDEPTGPECASGERVS